jgi:hypothetical protein
VDAHPAFNGREMRNRLPKPFLLEANRERTQFPYYRFQINCTFLPKSEIFYTADVKNLGVRYDLPVD